MLSAAGVCDESEWTVRFVPLTPFYVDEAVTIYHGNCFEVLSGVLAEVGPVDHAISDPPFTQRTSEKARSGGPKFGMVSDRTITFDGVDGREAQIASMCLQAALRWVIVFCALEQVGRYADAAGANWIRGTAWHRTNSAPQFTGDRPGQSCEGIAIMHRKGRKRWNKGGTSLFYDGPTVNSVGDKDRGTEHPTVKPSWLMSSIVADFTDPGESILDPFMGSGTTLVAAKRLGRKAIGIEINEAYCEIAANRLRQGALNLFAPPCERPSDELHGAEAVTAIDQAMQRQGQR